MPCSFAWLPFFCWSFFARGHPFRLFAPRRMFVAPANCAFCGKLKLNFPLEASSADDSAALVPGGGALLGKLKLNFAGLAALLAHSFPGSRLALP